MCIRDSPVRPRKPDAIIRQGIESLKNTGYQEATLLSLSSSDYRPLDEVCDGLLEYCCLLYTSRCV